MTARDVLIALAVVSMLASCSFSLLGIVAAFRMNRAANRPTVRDRRLIEDMAHGEMLRAAGVCEHSPEVTAAIGCDCGLGRPW
jgi:hypothetical protein